MSETDTRTCLDEEVNTYRIAADGSRNVYVIQSGGHAPVVVVPETDERPAELFDLREVTTSSPKCPDEDGLGETDPDIMVDSSDHLDTILIRGVAEHMVAIDHAPYVDDSPRLLVWDEYPGDDEPPTDVPL